MVINGVRWVGDDTGADNEVDFIHADVGDDGIFSTPPARVKAGAKPTWSKPGWRCRFYAALGA